MRDMKHYLKPNEIYLGDARELLAHIRPESIACSIWSPPYHVGKQYEADMSYEEWRQLLQDVIAQHVPILIPGGFLVINIADILCFKDANMPKIQANNISRRRVNVTREHVLNARRQYPHYNKEQLAELLGCSEQTIDRRLHGNNVRGGKYADQTRVKLIGGMIEEMAFKAELYLYDRRIWVKDPAWENSKWHTLSYRSVDEFEYLYLFWKPGVTTIDRDRLTKDEWINWGSRGIWTIPSVRANDDHEAKFPLELPRRVIQLLTQPHDIVLDCFMGSGTTAIAAIQEERQFIGIEKERQYVNNAKKAIDEAIQQKNREKQQLQFELVG